MRRITSGVAVLAGVLGLASVAVAGNRSVSPITQAIKTIAFCRDKTSAFPDSAFNSYSPISAEFLQKIGKSYTGTIEEARQYKVTLLDQPKHGQAQLVYEPSHHWTYVPEEGYVGADRVIYLVGAHGKQYKVVVNFWVIPVIDENSDVQQCESINFGTQNGSREK